MRLQSHPLYRLIRHHRHPPLEQVIVRGTFPEGKAKRKFETALSYLKQPPISLFSYELTYMTPLPKGAVKMFSL